MFKSAVSKMQEKGLADREMSQVEITKNLKNGYLALGATFVMTLIGYAVGLTMLPQLVGVMSGAMGAILMLVAMLGMVFAISAFQNSVVGLVLLLAFGFIEGLIVTPMIALSSSSAVFGALAGTVVAVFATSAIAFSGKVDSSGWGKYLMIMLLAMIVGVVINIFLGSTGFQLILSLGIIALMCALMIYDTQQAMRNPKMSYVAVALGFYLNIINIFINLLSVIGISED